MDNDLFRRKTPEEILVSIAKLHKGRFKVIIGAVSGSGKTYHMLREGQNLKQKGIDVAICAVSTLQRPETIEQIGDLERIPSIHWYDSGKEKKDLNLDAIVARNPEVLLVDGLAHRNRKEARFPTRADDIRFLLNQGISVITTVNVYELEGVHMMVQKLTGIEVRETVPADMLELADEVRLIDVSPETILNRAAEGHLGKANTNVLLQKGNLAVLRELALRIMAEGVNDSLEKYREALGMVGPSGATERILVSVQYHWNGSIYTRRGQQIAKRLNGELLVVTFVNRHKQLNKDEEAFKRSILKLITKLSAKFEELPMVSRRVLPRVLVQYALEHNATRIVLGHSRQTRWQEFLQGSIVLKMLERTKNIDIFLMADRTEHEGERILPARTKETDQIDKFHRLSADELEKQIRQIRRGHFKVFIGAAPGVGKTYTMLREGNLLLKKGIDVMVGLLETHGRKETAEQVGELTVLPRKKMDYRGTTLEEMDTESIIRRNPEVVLIDELAHTNVPGSANKKRYEDVIHILESGISVISTMNVQHLESLNDAVEQITGVRVRETVPDFILRMADEAELIDLTPQALQERLKEGKVYAMNKVGQALGAFFKTGNLIALRELALREIADDVDERLEAWQRKNSLRGPWRRQEVIFVGVSLNSNAERLIRRGFRIAYRLKAEWHVVYVEAELKDGKQTHDTERRIQELNKLTEQLGGIFEKWRAVNRKEIPHLLVNKANEYKATQIIIGQSTRSLWHAWLYGSIVKTILRTVRHIDVLIVADFDPKIGLQ